MPAWAYVGIGFIVGLILFLAMFRYAPVGLNGIRWVFISCGLGAAFLVSPAFVWLLLRGAD